MRVILLLMVCGWVMPGWASALPWQLQGWNQRAVVEVKSPGSAHVDTAGVRILHSGSSRGDDYRVLDWEGKAVPYQLAFHDPRRDSLLLFKAPAGRGTFTIYWDNPSAPRDPMRTLDRLDIGQGPPQPGPQAQGWIPRAGLTLITMRRDPQAENPETPEQMQQLIASSAALDGAGFRTNINDGINPFGDSDHFISIYRGWINLPRSGEWGLCTASNEASFTFINGSALVHWPGRHTEDRGKFGQKNAVRQLEAGLHYIEYYHEEALLYQVAFLGMRPPGQGPWQAIPDDWFVRPHQAEVTRYQTAPGNLSLHPRLEILDSLWPKGRSEGQHTRVKLRAWPGSDAVDLLPWQITWQLGDGIIYSGREGEHIYLTTGEFIVHLQAQGPGGEKIQRTWPLNIFRIEHATTWFKDGDPRLYETMVRGYDPSLLVTPSLAEWARSMSQWNEREKSATAARLLLNRQDASGDELSAAHVLAAGLAVGNQTRDRTALGSDPKQVAEHLRAALDKEADVIERLRLTARLIRWLGVELLDVESADQLYAQTQTFIKTQKLAGAMQRAYREVVVAAGDARLASGQIDEAMQEYRLAEVMDVPVVPPQVRIAQIGSFPEAIEQHLQAKRLADAQLVVERWRERFPSDQVRGAVQFYQGKVDYLSGHPRQAIRWFKQAVVLGQGNEFEAQARWLLAMSYKDIGDDSSAQSTLRELLNSGLAGEYHQQAQQMLQAKP